MTAIEYERTFALDDIEIQRGGDGRTVTAYAAVFDQDAEIRDQHGHYVERIAASAFTKTLAERGPRDGKPGKIGVYFNHGYDLSGRPNGLLSVPIGTPLEIRADGRGLLTVTRYNRSEVADSVLEAIRDGQIQGQSFRGRVFADRKNGARGELPIVVRTELGLTEYGPTRTPAYEGAGIVAVRSKEELYDLVRAIMTDMNGTDPAAVSTTPTGEPGTPEPRKHSELSRQVRRNVNRARALRLGVINATTPQAE